MPKSVCTCQELVQALCLGVYVGFICIDLFFKPGSFPNLELSKIAKLSRLRASCFPQH